MSFTKICDICLGEFSSLTCYNVCKKCLYEALMNSDVTQPLQNQKIDFITLEKIFSEEDLNKICTKHFLKIIEPRLEWFKSMMKNVEDNFEFSEDEVAQCLMYALKFENINCSEIYLQTDKARYEKDLNKLVKKIDKLIRPLQIKDLESWLNEVSNLTSINAAFHIIYPDLEKFIFTHDRNETNSILIKIYEEYAFNGSNFDPKLLRLAYKEFINKSIYKNENCGRCRCNLGVISSSDYTCNVCKKKSCRQCLNFEHDGSCAIEDMKLKHYYDTQCQSCPECGVWIEKLNGCDDMFCTFCHTSFSFNYRKRLYGNVHNPHRSDYLNSINKTDTNFDVTSDAVYWSMDNLTYLVSPTTDSETDLMIEWLIQNFNKLSSIDPINVFNSLKLNTFFHFGEPDLDLTFGGLLIDPSISEYVLSYDVVENFLDMINPISENEMKVRNSLIVDYLTGTDLNSIAKFYMRVIIWNRNDEKRKVMIELGEALFKIYQTILEYRIKENLFVVDESFDEDEYTGLILTDHEKELLETILATYCTEDLLIRVKKLEDLCG